MSRVCRILFGTVCMLLLAFSAKGEIPALTPSPIAKHLLVVYNSQDSSSKELADYYASMRGIPAERVLGIACSANEEISRDDYDNTVRKPIEDYIISKGWMTRSPTKLTTNLGVVEVKQSIGNQIWAIALIRGIPLKIAEDPNKPFAATTAPEFKTNKASVDSELALITFDQLPLDGHIGNVFYTSQGGRAYGQMFADYFVMVTRLDGPTPQLVKEMIRNSVETEKLRLTGRAVFDARGIHDPKNNYIMGDEWIRSTANLAATDGFDVVADDNPELIQASAPYTDVAFYAGWYEQDAKGLMTRPNFRFRPGAVAYHIHSFSAATVRSETQNWAGPLIARGAVATMGAVYEPYLQFTPNVASFYHSLAEGLTFAEAAYQSQNALSWMVTFIGDPLYRPFYKDLDAAIDVATKEKAPQLDWLLGQKARRSLAAGAKALTRDTLAQGIQNAPTSVMWESKGDTDSPMGSSPDETINDYNKAKELATLPVDKIRIGLKIANIYRQQHMPDKALQTYDKLITEFPNESSYYQVANIAVNCATEAGLKQVAEALKTQLGIPNPGAKP